METWLFLKFGKFFGYGDFNNASFFFENAAILQKGILFAEWVMMSCHNVNDTFYIFFDKSSCVAFKNFEVSGNGPLSRYN